MEYKATEALKWFTAQIEANKDYRVLEIGTRRWGKNATHHKAMFPCATEYIMSDIMEGEDVDVLADLHKLTETFAENSFDFIIACSVFEHLEKPWLAAPEILKVLKPGGCFFVQTHHAFPIHGYPVDYFRFTEKGLESLFDKASERISGMEFPAKIHSERDPGVKNCTAWLNSVIAGRK